MDHPGRRAAKTVPETKSDILPVLAKCHILHQAPLSAGSEIVDEPDGNIAQGAGNVFRRDGKAAGGRVLFDPVGRNDVVPQQGKGEKVEPALEGDVPIQPVRQHGHDFQAVRGRADCRNPDMFPGFVPSA